jgi:hypothetical protein
VSSCNSRNAHDTRVARKRDRKPFRHPGSRKSRGIQPTRYNLAVHCRNVVFVSKRYVRTPRSSPRLRANDTSSRPRDSRDHDWRLSLLALVLFFFVPRSRDERATRGGARDARRTACVKSVCDFGFSVRAECQARLPSLLAAKGILPIKTVNGTARRQRDNAETSRSLDYLLAFARARDKSCGETFRR